MIVRAYSPDARDRGHAWSVRARGGAVWFACNEQRQVLGPFCHEFEARAASGEECKSVATATQDNHDGEFASMSVASASFPEWSACVEDVDEDADCGVWIIGLRPGSDLYFGGTSKGPLPHLYSTWASCLAAVMSANILRSTGGDDYQ